LQFRDDFAPAVSLKKPLLVGVAGAHSGTGKTYLICRLLKELPHWGAIKYSPSNLYSSITDDSAVLLEEGKDTARYLNSGAEKVLWIQSAPQDLPDAVSTALEMSSFLQGIFIEGNGAVEVITPDLLIFLCQLDKEAKESSEKLLASADIVICKDAGRLSSRGKVFRREEEDAYMLFIRNRILHLLSD
jgi:hypothetical protein